MSVLCKVCRSTAVCIKPNHGSKSAVVARTADKFQSITTVYAFIHCNWRRKSVISANIIYGQAFTVIILIHSAGFGFTAAFYLFCIKIINYKCDFSARYKPAVSPRGVKLKIDFFAGISPRALLIIPTFIHRNTEPVTARRHFCTPPVSKRCFMSISSFKLLHCIGIFQIAA